MSKNFETLKNEDDTVEIISIFVDAWPKWTGATIESKKYSPQKNDDGVKYAKRFRFDFNMPIPTNDDEAQQLYGVTMAKILAAGVSQISYAETSLTKKITDHFNAGDDMESEALFDALAKAAPQDFIRQAKKQKVSEARQNKDTLTELYVLNGIDPNAPDARDQLLKAIKAKKG